MTDSDSDSDHSAVFLLVDVDNGILSQPTRLICSDLWSKQQHCLLFQLTSQLIGKQLKLPSLRTIDEFTDYMMHICLKYPNQTYSVLIEQLNYREFFPETVETI